MNRHHYLRTVIRLFLEQPGAPDRASRADWATAQNLYRHGVPLQDILQAIRLAALRRQLRLGPPLPHVRTLAYYRLALEQLTPEEREPEYVDYVARRYRLLCSATRASENQNRALSDSR